MVTQTKIWVYPVRIMIISMILLGLFTTKSYGQGGAPPMVTDQPSGITVSLLGTAVFTAKSKRGTSYQWLKNGVPVTGGVVLNLPDLDLLSGKTDSTLTLALVGSGVAGTYTLKVSNLSGSVTSSPAILLLSNVVNVVTNTLDFVASATGKVAAGFKIQLTAPTGTNVVIQASTDLKNWTSLYTNTAGGTVNYMDSAATNMVFRYYRAKLQ